MKPAFRHLIFLFLFIVIGCTNSYKVYVLFDNVEGLKENSEVMANGMPIGEVDHMQLDKKGVLVTLAIDDEHKIPDNSTILFFEPGLLANKQIEITTGTSNKMLKEGDTLRTVFTAPKHSGFNMEKLDTIVTKAINMMAKETKPEKR